MCSCHLRGKAAAIHTQDKNSPYCKKLLCNSLFLNGQNSFRWPLGIRKNLQPRVCTAQCSPVCTVSCAAERREH